MPGVPTPGDGQLAYQIAQLMNHVRGQASQQQETLTNSKGQPVLNFGLSPGSNPAQFGLQFLNPATGGQLMFVGEDGAGNPGVYYFNGSGTKVSQYDETGLHFYDASGNELTRLDSTGFHSYDTSGHELTRIDATGLHVYDDTGTEQVAGGLVNPSPAIYGLAVKPPAGSQLQMVSGYASVSPPNVIGTAAAGWTAFGSPNSVTVDIGPSGMAEVTIAGELSSSGGGVQPFVSVGVDGAAPGASSPYMSADSGAGTMVVTGSGSAVMSSLTTGSHTFELYYEVGGGGTASFTGMQLIVQPL